MKLKDLFEAKEKNLLGLEINGKLITDKTHLEKWEGNFYCDNNQLTSLEHCPTSVDGDFFCSHNKLTSLEHCPTSVVGGNFYCDHNKLTSLEHCPSLKDVHKHIKQISGVFYADGNPIKSHVLGLLLIKGCAGIMLDNKKVQNIVNKYLPNDRGHSGLAACEDELIEAGLEDYAQL